MKDQLKTLGLGLIACALSATTFALPVAAQTDTTVDASADCEANFTMLDADNNGFLSDTEAPQVWAYGRVNSMTIGVEGITKEQYLAACTDNAFSMQAPEAGAPLAGSNSFTESQAKDRAVAWGVTGISALTQDDQGIWRGTGMVGGAGVNVAIDYKGNVVTTAK